MKILMLTSFMDIGGAETHIAELCRGLMRSGHTVEVASAGGKYADMLAKEGVVQYILPLGCKDVISVAKCLRTLRGIIRAGEYDIVHAHSRIPAAICDALRDRLGFRFVSTAHLNFKVNAVLRRITKWGDATMAVSEDLADYLNREYGVPRERVSVTVNGIDMNRFAPSMEYREKIRREFGISEEDRLIVYISRLDEDRSVPAKLLCRIIPKLFRMYSDVRLLIVGDGNDADEVKRLAAEANNTTCSETVLLSGARYDVYRITAAADMVCAVSRSALEAMAAGCPVILSGNQGHMGIFDEEKLKCAVETNFCCRGCPAPTEELLLRDVAKLLESDRNILCAMGKYNRFIVSKYYSLERMTDDYIDMYEKMIKTSPVRKIEAVISGYFGYGNSGDDTALDCLVAAIRQEYPGAALAVLCRDPKKFGKAHNIIGIGRYDILSVVQALRRSGVLISGGGSLLQNVTSTRSLRYYAGIIGLARLCGAKIFICANGIGPLVGERSRRIAYKAVMKADRISVRDEASRKVLGELGVPENAVSLTADPAFRLTLGDKCDVSQIKRNIGMRDGVKYFAVSLREAMSRGDRGVEICRGCRDIYLTLGYTPIFISMQESEDAELCRRIAENTCGEALVIPALPPDKLYSLVSEMELVLSMRLHLIIYAAAAGVPAVGVSVDPKLDAVVGVLGSAELVSGEDFNAESCLDAVKRAVCTDKEKLLKIAREQARLAEDDARAAVRMMKGEADCSEVNGHSTAFDTV